MPKRIINVLKTMGSALEAANAGEMLTKKQKEKVMHKHKDPIAEKSDLRNK
jgi:hypothetical protein